MAGRPVAPSSTSALRLEILRELQQLTENRDARDRLDRSPLAETKGREHWVLHLLLRASEIETSHTDTLIGSAYSNLVARLESLEDRLGRIEEMARSLEGSVRSRIEGLDQVVGTRVETTLAEGSDRIGAQLGRTVQESLDRKWAPIGDSIESFAQGSKQIAQGVDDTYRLATQNRLLANETARRVSDLGRDILALEDSVKLVVSKTLEQGLAPLEHRLAAIEAQLGLANGESPLRHGEKRTGSTPAAGTS